MMAYTIPEFAAGEGMQFQVRAKDKAGNYGAGYSKVILVSGYQEPEPKQAHSAGQMNEQPVDSPSAQPINKQQQAIAASPKPEDINP